jgi:hypothetical protein
LILGCGDPVPGPAEQSASDAPPAGSAFDPASAGSVCGRVTWEGDIPSVPRFKIRPHLPAEGAEQRHLIRKNPNAPVVDAATRGVAGAVVYLRGVDPLRGRPWDHDPVRVEQRGRRLHVRQGGRDGRVGFVRRGDSVEVVSRDSVFHALHAGGAAFFSLAFPDPGQPLSRPLPETGLVELTSAAGYYWMRAYLFVDDHPYYALTDAHGRFELRQVPPGRYELVCWMPNWLEDRTERDPETGLVARLFFGPPAEQSRPVLVEKKGTCSLDFVFSTGAFRNPAVEGEDR